MGACRANSRRTLVPADCLVGHHSGGNCRKSRIRRCIDMPFGTLPNPIADSKIPDLRILTAIDGVDNGKGTVRHGFRTDIRWADSIRDAAHQHSQAVRSNFVRAGGDMALGGKCLVDGRIRGWGGRIRRGYRVSMLIARPTGIRSCSATPTGSTSGAPTPGSTSPSRRGRTSAPAHSSPVPKPRSYSVDS